MKKCTSCGADNKDSAPACTDCGAKFQEAKACTIMPEEPLRLRLQCPRCGADIVDGNDGKCGECGYVLRSDPIPLLELKRAMAAAKPPKKQRHVSVWMKWEGPVIEFRRKYLEERIKGRCRLLLEAPGNVSQPPPEQVLEALSLVEAVNLGEGDFELDLVPFIRYMLNDEKFELPDWGPKVWEDVRSLVDLAYWAYRSPETKQGTPRQILDRARKLLPASREGPKISGLGSRSYLWLHSRVATALVDLLDDRLDALDILAAARDTLGKANTGGRDYVAVARGYLDALGDTHTALALAKELEPKLTQLKDASSYIELGALYIDLGELELARGVLGRLQSNGNLSSDLPVKRWTWEELAQLWLDLNDVRNASLALDAGAVEGARPPAEPTQERTFEQIATKLFDKGTFRACAL